MILSNTEIKALVRHGLIIVEPRPAPDQYTTSAVDLTCGDEFYRWTAADPGMEQIIDPGNAGHDYRTLAARHQERVTADADGSVVLRRGEFVLCTTRERVELPITTRIAARVEGRSSLARYGVGIHVTAPTIHAGFRGRITLKVTHSGVYPVRLRPGMRICQLVFEQLNSLPSEEMRGAFQDQETPQGRTPTSAK